MIKEGKQGYTMPSPKPNAEPEETSEKAKKHKPQQIHVPAFIFM